MDPDSSLATVALVLSLSFCVVLSLVEGYLLSGLREDREGEGGNLHRMALSSLRDGGVRSLVRVVLTTAFVVSGVALLTTLTSRGWIVALGTFALLLSLVLVQSLFTSLGVRWGVKARLPLPLFWPLALLASPLAWLQNSVMAAFSRGNTGTLRALEYPNNLANGSSVELLEAEEEERRMITSILKLDETAAREIMVPRMDIVATEATSSLNRIAELMWEGGHSRIPIYEETVDSVVGVVHSRDLLRQLSAGDPQVDPTSIARPPLFIPDSKRLDDLLRDFQEKHIQIAIVMDEYGGVAGLVTIEDLLEEIVGEIEDEFDIEESLREMLSETEAVMDARISLEEVNEAFDVDLRGEGFDTLGGLLYQLLGKIPSPGEEVEAGGLRIKVLSTLGRRIKKVQVTRAAASESF